MLSILSLYQCNNIARLGGYDGYGRGCHWLTRNSTLTGWTNRERVGVCNCSAVFHRATITCTAYILIFVVKVFTTSRNNTQSTEVKNSKFFIYIQLMPVITTPESSWKRALAKLQLIVGWVGTEAVTCPITGVNSRPNVPNKRESNIVWGREGRKSL